MPGRGPPRTPSPPSRRERRRGSRDSRRRRRAWRGGCPGEAWRKTGRGGGAEGNAGDRGDASARGALGTRAGAVGRTNAPRRALGGREASRRDVREHARVRAWPRGSRSEVCRLEATIRHPGARLALEPVKSWRLHALIGGIHITRVGHPSPATLASPSRRNGHSGRLEDRHNSEPAPLGAELNLEVRRRRPPSPSPSCRLSPVPTPRRRLADPRPHPSRRWTSPAASASPTRTGRSDTSWT